MKVGVVVGMEVSAVASVCKSLSVNCSSNAKLKLEPAVALMSSYVPVAELTICMVTSTFRGTSC